MTCNGICVEFKPMSRSKGYYLQENGKRCTHCSTFIIFVGLYCPCCGHRLKTHPTNNKYRKPIIEKMKQMNQIIDMEVQNHFKILSSFNPYDENLLKVVIPKTK